MNEQRVARVRAEMQAHGLTQMIISDSKSIWYLTGASVEPYERLMALYLPVQGEPVIFLNKLFFVPETNIQAKTKKCNHKNVTWITTSKPSCTDEGMKVKKCKNCGKILKIKKIKKCYTQY